MLVSFEWMRHSLFIKTFNREKYQLLNKYFVFSDLSFKIKAFTFCYRLVVLLYIHCYTNLLCICWVSKDITQIWQIQESLIVMKLLTKFTNPMHWYKKACCMNLMLIAKINVTTIFKYQNIYISVLKAQDWFLNWNKVC